MKKSTRDSYFQRIDRVVGYLNDQVQSAPTLQDLADVAAISPFHFHRVYRAITGETPSATLRRSRLARAATLLKTTAKPITEIAFDVGYESSQAFSKAFREVTGFSASDLRARPKKLEALIKTLSSPKERSSHRNSRAIDVKLVSVEPFKVIAYRHVGPPSELSGIFPKVFDWAEETGVMSGFKGIYGIPLDDPRSTAPGDCRFDCCLDLGPDVTAENDFTAKHLGGGLFAVTRHIGPYEVLDEKYDYLYGPWLAASGYVLRDQPFYNHYVVDPDSVPPEKWITDIYLPIEKIT